MNTNKLLSIVIMLLSLVSFAQEDTKRSLIIDADTGNEVDDYYALVRAFVEPSWNITALNAAQWQSSQWAIPETMENSHRLNQVLLGELEMDIKTRRGGIDRMFDWGDMAQHSAAAYEIIAQAKALEEGQKLTIVALGALTNVASAIYIKPEIASRIQLYWLGTTYDFKTDIFKRQDFNCMMDPQALELLLNSEAELHIMPLNVAQEMQFDYLQTKQRLPEEDNLSRLLLERWFHHLDGGRKERIIWDLALIQAMIFPQWTTQKVITTSKDNGLRQIHYYTSIDADKMREEFFETMNRYIENR